MGNVREEWVKGMGQEVSATKWALSFVWTPCFVTVSLSENLLHVLALKICRATIYYYYYICTYIPVHASVSIHINSQCTCLSITSYHMT